MELMRLEWHLENWRDYMRTPSHKLGYPSKSLCISSGNGSAIESFEIECEKVDLQCAITMEAMIDSLPREQSCAINHKWLHAVYALRNIEHAYEMAIDNLMVMADKRGLV